MQAPQVARYGFRIRTRQGLVVDPVVIPGRDEADAERKVRQIYRDCEIIGRSVSASDGPTAQELAARLAR